MSPIRPPPCSPELNPIENLWHYLRSHDWSNRFYADWDALIEAAAAGMVAVGTHADLIKTVCAVPYPNRPDSVTIK